MALWCSLLQVGDGVMGYEHTRITLGSSFFELQRTLFQAV
jgi:hypothetical protein